MRPIRSGGRASRAQRTRRLRTVWTRTREGTQHPIPTLPMGPPESRARTRGPRFESALERGVVELPADGVGDRTDLAPGVGCAVGVNPPVADLGEDLERGPARQALAEPARAFKRLADEPLRIIELARGQARPGELGERLREEDLGAVGTEPFEDRLGSQHRGD